MLTFLLNTAEKTDFTDFETLIDLTLSFPSRSQSSAFF